MINCQDAKRTTYFPWLLPFFCQFFFMSPLAAQTEVENLMSAAEVFSYAQTLEREGDFNRAATEYGRFIFFLQRHPDHSFKNAEEAYYRHALTLANAGLTEQSLQAFAVLGEKFPHSASVAPALLRMGRIYEEAGMVTEARQRYQQVIARAEWLAPLAQLRLVWLALQEEDGVMQAKRQLAGIAPSALGERVPTIDHALDSLTHLPRKDPWFAGGMTAFLPGSGHLYLDRPQDGLVAFLSNGLLLTGTIQAFRRDLSGLGLALGVIELGWYTGTIYSAVSLTHQYNRRVRAERLQEIRPLLYPEPHFLGLELNLHY